jgi:alpha-tubulin suppressor-like RCC1 family protein
VRMLLTVLRGAASWSIPLPGFVSLLGAICTLALAGPASAASGSAAAWGDNGAGQLGDGTSTSSDVPVAVSGLSGVTAVAAGGEPQDSLAMLSNGTVMAWGSNEWGQLGNGSQTGSSTCFERFGFAIECTPTPVMVSGLSGATAIAAGGDDFSLALLKDGTVMAWGQNDGGQLGDGTSTGPSNCSSIPSEPDGCSTTPVAVSGLSGVMAIAAGTSQSLALLSDGTVMTWGDGQLGRGQDEESDEPIAVSGLSEVTAVAAGGRTNLALLKNGTVMAWGENQWGQLGNGSTTESGVPMAVNGLSGVTAIAAGDGDSLALLSNGTVMAWGLNDVGQLGRGTTTGPDGCPEVACSTTPVAVSGLSGVTAIAAGEPGDGQLLALLSNGTVVAWGKNGSGQLGDGTTVNSDTPVAVSGLDDVTAIAAGDEFSLAAGALTPIPSVTNLEPNSGPPAGGTSVTITGTNFTGATAVKFGTANATSFTVNSETSITAVSPAGTGTADVTVTNPAGTSGTNSADRFTYGPTVTNVEPKYGPPAGGTSVTITGTNFTGATAVKFGTTNATSFTANSATSITAVSPAGTGTVDVTVTTEGATSATSSGDQFSYGPSVTNVEPNNGPTAGGTSVSITGTNLVGVTAVKFGTANAASFTVNSPTSITAVSPAGTGAVHVTVTTEGGTSTGSSADEFSYGPAVTRLEPEYGPPGGGTSVTITGTHFTGTTAVKFGSTDATSFTVNSSTSITAVAPAGTGTVDVTVTTPEGTSLTSRADEFHYGPNIAYIEPGGGPAVGGTAVSITGTNFTGAAAVMFGSVPARSFTVNSDTSITAVSPGGKPGYTTGTAYITVTTPGGTSTATSGGAFHYRPIVTSVSPNNGPAAGGTFVRITGEGFEGPPPQGPPSPPFSDAQPGPWVGPVMFGSIKARSFRVISATTVEAVAPAGTGTVNVTVDTGDGTSTISPADQFTYPAETAPSEVVVEPAESTANGFMLRGRLNPGNSPTSYYFAYRNIEEGECEDLQGCGTRTTEGGPLAGDTQQEVSPIEVTGLAPGKTYVYSLIARNAKGTVRGDELTFTAQSTSSGGGGSTLTPGATLPGSPFGATPKPKPLTLSQMLKRALKACAREPKSKRARCAKQARAQMLKRALKACAREPKSKWARCARLAGKTYGTIDRPQARGRR